MKKLVFLASGLLAISGLGCDSSNGVDDSAVDDAMVVAALSQGEGESLDDVSAGDVSSAADEEADGAVDSEVMIENDCSLSEVRERILTRYDQNGDGEIDLKEHIALKADLLLNGAPRLHWGWQYRLLRLNWVYDADDSGRLSKEERQARRGDLEIRCERRLEEFLASYDTDNNGSLSEQELAKVREAVKAKKQAKVEQVLVQYDQDDDSKLNRAERKALVTDLIEKIKVKRQQLLDKFDLDRDGELNSEEKARLREYLRSRIRGETADNNR